jgi:hypothetical protein
MTTEPTQDATVPADREPLRLPLSDELGAAAEARCWCHACRPVTVDDMRMVLCPYCGCKRCPKANDHRNACTDSNDADQLGSAYGRDLCSACVTPAACTRDQRCLVVPW